VLTTHYLEEAEALADRVCVISHGRMIHEGTVDDLRARVSVKRIRCATTLLADDVRGWPEVAEAKVEARRLHIATGEAEAVVRRLLDADPDLRELEVQRAGLAEAFTELTRDADAAFDIDQREVA
jgi:ABC-2 type transport system ATP-binding protein